jgi:hypothetical protein
VTDDLTRQLAEQILRGMRELHKEHNPSEPLSPGTPVAPQRPPNASGSALLGARTRRRQGPWRRKALQPNMRPGGDVKGDLRYVLGARGPDLMEGE